MSNTRAIAAQILAELLNGSGSLTTLLAPHREHKDFKLLQEICFGSCRWFHLLQALLQPLLTKPLKNKDRDIFALLIIGLYQIREMRIPDHAAINETVNASKVLGKHWSKSLVNAVLRNYLRRADELNAGLNNLSRSDLLSHAPWMEAAFSRAWPQQSEAIMHANNSRPPFSLRVNLSKTNRAEYLATLAAADISAQPGKLAATAVILDRAMDVTELPGFTDGLVSVQDEASQLVTPLLQLAAGQSVLDACAAPGGKTCHILESEQALTSVVAVDNSGQRLQRVRENLSRLQLDADLLTADAAATDTWWNRNPFDRILLDAPCSGTGVIRRHPDIKLLRRHADLAKLCEQQEQILNSLWSTLKPDGLLLYTSCSILPEENNLMIERFLEARDDAKYEGVAADWGVECGNGRQLLPDLADGPDGFFYSLLRKL